MWVAHTNLRTVEQLKKGVKLNEDLFNIMLALYFIRKYKRIVCDIPSVSIAYVYTLHLQNECILEISSVFSKLLLKW